MSMSNDINVAVIGGGIFGSEIAIEAKACGLTVGIFEAKDNILLGASGNNLNRLHLGFHYPRDIETGKQSIRGFEAFKHKYPECIQGEFQNAYFVANNNSLTPAPEFFEFCELLGVNYEKISASEFPVKVQNADKGILCDEVVYDFNILRDLLWNSLRHSNVEISLGDRVEKVSRAGEKYKIETENQNLVYADVVVNASYADINRISSQLGHEVAERQYEYTAVPIISIDIPRVGITVLDGPFMTLLPYGKSDEFLLYHVEHTRVAKKTSSQMDPNWLVPDTAPFSKVDKQQYFKKMIELCSEYVPDLARAKLVGYLEGPRMILAHKEGTDARPSIVSNYEDSYFTVFAGKVDHCVWVADDICEQIKTKFNL
ncbi:MAG TPA: FAD-binding oxidoreductase [candidate division Zixibacteria bacterium]|nr:FAD-binding oxidoreductase [candidate division Zixibacteria bacterium]